MYVIERFALLLMIFGVPIALGTAVSIFVSRIGSVSPDDLDTFSKMRRAFRNGKSASFSSDNRHNAAVFAMRGFAEERASPDERALIATLMRDKIITMIDRPDNDAANKVLQMLQTLEAADPPWQAEFLETVARSRMGTVARWQAIAQRVKLTGHKARDLLLELAGDPDVANEVARSFARLGPRNATPQVIDCLFRMVEDTRNPFGPVGCVRALVVLGQADDPRILGILDRLDPWTSFVVRAHARKLGASDLVEQMVSSGLVGEDRRPLIKASTISRMQRKMRDCDGFGAVLGVLKTSKSVFNFDAERDPFPDYAQLLRGIDRISEPRVRITAIRADGGGDVIPHEVSCNVAGHIARFSPRDLGDWVDLDGMISALNGALLAAGHPMRFAILGTVDQTAQVVLVDARGLVDLAEGLGLPIG